MNWLKTFVKAFTVISLTLIAIAAVVFVLIMMEKGAIGVLAGFALVTGIASATIATLNAVVEWFYCNWD